MIGTELLPGDPRELGPYLLQSRLGAGGMGVVYLAAQAGRLLAVKAIRQDVATDPEFRRRFAREIDAARRVSGAGTAALVDADALAPIPWLATEYLAGPTLEAAIRDHGPLPASQLLPLAIGLAVGLAAIHEIGLVHRDLKPSNVLLTATGPKIIDFGIAYAVEATSVTKTGLILGTPGYISPEQIKGAPVGDRTDVFAWAGTLLFAATGRPPFGDGRSDAVLFRVLNIVPDVDAVESRLRASLRKAFAQDPTKRPSAAALVGMLGGVEPARDYAVTSILETTWSLPSKYWTQPTVGPLFAPTSLAGPSPKASRGGRRVLAIGGATALALTAGLSAYAALGSPASSGTPSALPAPSKSAASPRATARALQPAPLVEPSVASLAVGDCLETPPDGVVTDLAPTDCSQPHDGEIFHSFELPAGDFPGDSQVRMAGEAGCLEEFERFVGLDFNASELGLLPLTPTSEGWAAGDRDVLCIVQDEVGGLNASLRSARR